MSATDDFKAGKLVEAIETQTKVVKANPLDPGRRLFLFELLAFVGDLDRARRQVEAIRCEDPQRDATVQLYRQLLDSETARRLAFLEGGAIATFGAIPAYVQMRMEAVRHLGHGAEAVRLLERAHDDAPNLKVVLNGKPHDGLIDADDVLGDVLEVMTNGQYYWIPMEQVSTLAMNEPRSPRDLLWIPARIELTDGQTGEVFLPALYPGSHLHPDDNLKLGRATDWKTAEDGPVVGVGQKTYLAGEDPVGILEWRELTVMSS